MITVKQVNDDKKGMRDFIDLPYELYKDDGNWVPPLRWERKNFFSEENPFMEHSQVSYWVAYEGARPVGRLTAHIDEVYNRYHDTRQGLFGFFESREDLEIAEALGDSAENWLKERRMTSVLGPFNFSTNHEVGFLIKGFDRAPVFMMPYTKSYYPDLFYKLGYRKEKELIAFWLGNVTEIPEILTKISVGIEEKMGDTVQIRNLNMGALEADLEIIRDIYNEAWGKNWGFVPMTEKELEVMAKELKRFADPELIYILFKDGEPAAFMLCMMDLNQAFKQVKDGRLFPTGIFKLLSYKKYITQGRILMMGVKSRFRLQGLDFLLYYKLSKDRVGITDVNDVELSWILEDNVAMINILKSLNADPYKRYLILKKDLA